jgi:hypothetical protein
MSLCNARAPPPARPRNDARAERDKSEIEAQAVERPRRAAASAASSATCVWDLHFISLNRCVLDKIPNINIKYINITAGRRREVARNRRCSGIHRIRRGDRTVDDAR